MFRTYASQYAAKPNKSQNKHQRCKHLSDRLNLITKAGSFSYELCIISTVEVLSNHFKYFAAYFHVLPGISQARNNKMNLFLSTVDSEARIKLRVATINYKLHELEYTPTTLPANSIKLHLLFSRSFKCQTCTYNLHQLMFHCANMNAFHFLKQVNNNIFNDYILYSSRIYHV